MTKSIFKSGNAWFFEDVKFAKGDQLRTLFLKRNMLIFPYVIGIDQDLIPDFVQNTTNQYNIIERKFYDTINFYQAIESSNPQKWIDAINEDIKSMKDNDVWDLFIFPEGVKPINCK